MISRRKVSTLLGAAAIAPLAAACSKSGTGTIDPQAVADAIKNGCHIFVPLATVATIVNAAIGGTIQMIVDLVCSSYKSALAAHTKLGGAPLSVGSPFDFFVTINGKDIPVQATVETIQ